MSDQPHLPSDAADSDAFANIFSEGVGEPTIGSGADEPPASASGSADSGDPAPSGNPEPANASTNDGNPEPTGDGGDAAPTDPSNVQPKDDPERWQYWQSLADKRAAELEKFKSQVEAQNPLLQYINENPSVAREVYGLVEQKLEGSSADNPQQATATQPATDLKRPEKPTKPADYDPVDAVSDSSSESFKYRQKLDEYQEKLTDYNEAVMRSHEQRRQAQAQAEKQQAQKQQQMKQAYQEAVYRHGMQPQQAANFVQWASNPEFGMEDLIAVFNARSRNQGSAAQAADNLDKRNQRLNTPPPPAAEGNAATRTSEPDLDTADDSQMGEAFVDSLFGSVGQ